MYKDDEGASTLRFENLVFKKTGAEIMASVSVRIEEAIKKTDVLLKSIEDIAKRREIDPKEIIEAGEDQAKIMEYSNKMSNSMTAASSSHIPQGIIQALQKDIDNVQSYGRRLARQRFFIKDLTRIKNHLKADQQFELTFDELRTLGFH